MRTTNFKPSTSARHIIMVRHADYIEEDDKCVLSDKGVIQVKKTAERLVELDLPIESIVHSSMDRAKLTAVQLNEHLPVEERPISQCDLLCEGAPISPDPPISNWEPNPKQMSIDGVRLETAFRKYFHRASHDQVQSSCELIVCHANVIRYLICRVMQFPAEAWLRMTIPHCSITTITIEPNGKVWLRTLGENGHLKSSEGTY